MLLRTHSLDLRRFCTCTANLPSCTCIANLSLMCFGFAGCACLQDDNSIDADGTEELAAANEKCAEVEALL